MTLDEKIRLVERILNSGEDIPINLRCEITTSGRITVAGLPFDNKFRYDSCEEFCFGDSPEPSFIRRISFLTLVDFLGGSTIETYKILAKAYSKARSALKGVSSWEELELRLGAAGL